MGYNHYNTGDPVRVIVPNDEYFGKLGRVKAALLSNSPRSGIVFTVYFPDKSHLHTGYFSEDIRPATADEIQELKASEIVND